MQPTDSIRCEHRWHSNAGFAGYALIVPCGLWDDFRLFLTDTGIECGHADLQQAGDGTFEQLQFFPERNAAEVEQVKLAYLADYCARFLD